MSRNACHFYLPLLANRQLPLFSASTERSRKRGTTMRSTPATFTAVEIPLYAANLAVAETVANAICNAPTNTTVLLGFDNLVHFLDWLDAEQQMKNTAED